MERWLAAGSKAEAAGRRAATVLIPAARLEGAFARLTAWRLHARLLSG